MTTRGTDLLRAPDIHTNRLAATAVPFGALFSCSTHNLIYRSNGTVWSTWAVLMPTGTATGQVPTWDNTAGTWSAATPSAGSAGVKYVTATHNTGSYTLSSTSPAVVDSTLDLTLTAATGDLISYGISGVVNAAAVYLVFDVYTRVSGANVNPFGPGVGASLTPGGVQAWYTTAASQELNLSGNAVRKLVSGDISTGTVTLRLMYVRLSGTNRTLYATADNPFTVWAINHGPAT